MVENPENADSYRITVTNGEALATEDFGELPDSWNVLDEFEDLEEQPGPGTFTVDLEAFRDSEVLVNKEDTVEFDELSIDLVSKRDNIYEAEIPSSEEEFVQDYEWSLTVDGESSELEGVKSVEIDPEDYGLEEGDSFTLRTAITYGSIAHEYSVERDFVYSDGPLPLPGFEDPQDLNEDGLYDDVTGNGEVGVEDVQALFDNMDNIPEEDAQYFNFSGTDASEVTIFDVQALFNRI